MATKSKSAISRYQARVSLDDRMGKFFEMIMSLPERTRASRLVFMAQSWYEMQEAVHSLAEAAASGHRFSVVPAPASATPAQSPQQPARLQESPQASREQASDLGSWNMAAFTEIDVGQLAAV